MSDIEALKKLANEFLNNSQKFQVGDVVTWKQGLQNKRSDGPMIITAVLDEPILDSEENPSSPYFREQLDIKAGRLDRDGDLVEYHYDSRRFMKLEE